MRLLRNSLGRSVIQRVLLASKGNDAELPIRYDRQHTPAVFDHRANGAEYAVLTEPQNHAVIPGTLMDNWKGYDLCSLRQHRAPFWARDTPLAF